MSALNRRLKELYGARLDGSITKRGEIQIVTIGCEVLADEYALESERLLREACSLLTAVVFDPLVSGGAFHKEDVEIEKRNLADLIDSQLNDKRYYASERLKQEMCKNEAYGVYEYGTREQALAVTPQELYAAWTEMLEGARAEIFLIGGGADVCREMMRKAFSRVIRKNIIRCDTQIIRETDVPQTTVERLQVKQAKLGLGFRAGIATPENGVNALQLACTVLGGSPHSKLFLNVREKMSLCYYCYSRYERQKGLLFIESGIEEENFDKARNEILRQLDSLKAGDFTEDELHFAALSLENAYRELSDTLSGLAGWYLGQAVAGLMRTPAQAAAEIASLKKDDVVKAAAGIRLDTVYLLAGLEEAQ